MADARMPSTGVQVVLGSRESGASIIDWVKLYGYGIPVPAEANCG